MQTNTTTTSNYKSVRSLHRGLDVLCALNRHNGASVPQLSDSTGIHRTTVRRLLETLQRLGYVEKSPSDENYRLTLNVRRLSDGFDDDAWVSAVAGPALRDLHPKILWPTNVATYDYDAMLIRESSHRYSPFAIHHALVGQRLPILRTALGQVYIAFCPERERREILDILRSVRGPDAALARDTAFVRELVRKVRRSGHAVKPGDKEKRVAAIAVPIMRGQRVFASLNAVFFRSAMSLPEAVRKYHEPLRIAAEAMAARLGTDEIAAGDRPVAGRNTKSIPESSLKRSGSWPVKPR
jgi:IclR family mhp operon transcriptional activator